MAKRKKSSNNPLAALPPWLRSRYTLATAVFLLFVLWLDHRNVWEQLGLRSSIIRYEQKREQLKVDIDQARTDRLRMDEQNERFARETYFMQKDDEDVFIIVEEEDEADKELNR